MLHRQGGDFTEGEQRRPLDSDMLGKNEETVRDILSADYEGLLRGDCYRGLVTCQMLHLHTLMGLLHHDCLSFLGRCLRKLNHMLNVNVAHNGGTQESSSVSERYIKIYQEQWGN